ncbi:MAG: hypothetical protein Ct9H300mP27_01050 [Chloroflexota bacterium]|nr:MAG: hypothetical protein Ct9H300mP27_01050 [Chloroflexota bacterium]
MPKFKKKGGGIAPNPQRKKTIKHEASIVSQAGRIGAVTALNQHGWKGNRHIF